MGTDWKYIEECIIDIEKSMRYIKRWHGKNKEKCDFHHILIEGNFENIRIELNMPPREKDKRKYI